MNKKIFNKVEEFYILITILCYTLFSIGPVVALIKYTPFYSYQKYLGILGIIIIMADVIVHRKVFLDKNIIFMYVMAAIAVVSSLLTRQYGIKDNIFNIAWFGIMIYIFYNYARKCDKGQFEKFFRRIFYMVSSIRLVTILFSITSFLFHVGYDLITNPFSPESMSRQGFQENRLFGAFFSINNAALVTGIILVISIYMLFKEDKKGLKIFCGVNSFFSLVYIILSGSRSAYLGLILVVFLASIYYTVINYKKDGSAVVRWLISGVKSAVIVFVFMLAVGLLKDGLSLLPAMNAFEDGRHSYKVFISRLPETYVEGYDSNGMIIDELEEEEEELEGEDIDDILNRKDTGSGNISNNRFGIWKDYMSLYKEIGLIGLSPCNYSYEVIEQRPDLSIVQHIKEYYPSMYEDGKIYHPHNGYIFVYVSTGLIGVLCLIGFLLASFIDLIRYFVREKEKTSSLVIVFSLVIVYCLFDILFDQGVFLLSDLVSCIFWLVAGYVIKTVNETKQIKVK